MRLLRAVGTISGLTMLSRVFGLVRDMLIAAYLGAGAPADAFFMAFKLPNFLRRFFAEGAFTAGFVPMFSGMLERDGAAKARRFAGQAMAVLLAGVLGLLILAEFGMPWVVRIFAPGFADDPAKFALTVDLARITFPYLVFVSLVALLGGVLNSAGRFAAMAAAPVWLNLCLIVAIAGFHDRLQSPAHVLAWGLTAAGVVQLLWMLAACRRAGLLPPLVRPRLTPGVRGLLRRAGPAALGAGVMQVNIMVDTLLASLFPGGVSYLYYADRLSQLPLGVIGVAVSTALLPMLSRRWGAGDINEARTLQNRALEIGLFFAVPAAAALAIIATPVIALLFGHGAFEATAVDASAAALVAYTLGLPAFVMAKILTQSYFATHDTKTPVAIATVCLVANVILNLILMQYLAHVGLALATSLASWLNVALLAWGLKRRGLVRMDATLKARIVKIFFAAAAMTVALRALTAMTAPLLSHLPFGGIGAQAISVGLLVGGGGACYLAAAMGLRVLAWQDIRNALTRRQAG